MYADRRLDDEQLLQECKNMNMADDFPSGFLVKMYALLTSPYMLHPPHPALLDHSIII
jgi:hypothetical protein